MVNGQIVTGTVNKTTGLADPSNQQDPVVQWKNQSDGDGPLSGSTYALAELKYDTEHDNLVLNKRLGTTTPTANDHKMDNIFTV